MRHLMELRVYYEDTDFSGRVYHASYLRFMERGRTEWLRSRGYEHAELSRSSNLVFAVRTLEIEYLSPALMDDKLIVSTELADGKGATMRFQQSILRDEKLLAKAAVGVVALRNDRPVRPPRTFLT